MNLYGIFSDDVTRLWPVLEPFVVRALANSGGRYEPVHVMNAAVNGEMQVWVVAENLEVEPKAAVVTEVRTYPTGLKELNIFGVAGWEAAGWRHLVSQLEQYARNSGCKVAIGCGRPGWGRFIGWPERYRVFEKVLAA